MRDRESVIRRIYCRKTSSSEMACGLDWGKFCLWFRMEQLMVIPVRQMRRQFLSCMGLTFDIQVRA